MDAPNTVYDPDPKDDEDALTPPHLRALEDDGTPSGRLSAVPDTDDAENSEETPKSGRRHGLHAIPGGGEGDGVPAGDLSDASATSAEGGKAESAAGLAAAEATSAGRTAFKFDPNDPKHRGSIRMVMRAASGHKKGFLIGGALAGGLVATVVVFFFMLIPLKLESIVTNLQNHFFASSENAMENEVENMFSNYVKKSVLPALTKCGGNSIDKNCNPLFGKTTNPVNALYKGWSNARLENKLAEDYGIEFKAVKSGSVTKYYMKGPGISNPNGEDITKFAHPDDTKDLFTEVDRSGFKQNLRTALQNETKWKQVMYRYKVGRLLEEKYGLRRCLFFCGTTDALHDFANNKVNGWQIMMVQRVIVPRTQTMGIVLECLVTPSCEPNKESPTPTEPGSTGELAGEEESGVDDGIRTSLQSLAASYGIVDHEVVEKMIKQYNTIADKGYQKYLLEAILEKIGIQELSDNVTSSSTVVGWVNRVSKIIDALHGDGPKIEKLAYDTNSSAAVDLFETEDSYADEIHTGHGDATELGSAIDALSPGDHGALSDAEVGGTAGAEGSPLYSELEEGSSATPGAATAASNYKCNNGKTIPAGDQVCPEEVLGQGNALFNKISATLSTPPLSWISRIAHIWDSTVGKILGALGNLIGKITQHIPGIKNLSDLISKVVQPFFSFLEKKVIPNPFSSNMSGARIFDMAAAGADVAGNTFAHTGLGGAALTAAQAVAIQNQQQNEAKQQFEQEPLFARMFSTDSPLSLVSKLAVAMPSSAAGAESSFSGLLGNPFEALAHGFSSLFGSRASAAGVTPDAFGVTQYGDLSVPSDPAAYWKANCSDNPAQAYQNDKAFNNPNTNWNTLSTRTTDSKTGLPVNTTPNYCLLIKSSVGTAGGLFDTSLLTSDDLADVNNTSGTATTTPPGSYQNPFRDVKNLAPSRVDQGVDYTGSGPVYAIGDGKIINLTNSGWPGGTFIVYKLSDGPAAGKEVYMAENCKPIKVHIGEEVTPNTVLCDMVDSFPYIETGWANSSALGEAAAHDVWVGNDSDSYYTAYGKNFNEMLQSLNSPPPPAIIHTGAQELGTLPSGWPSWQ